MTELQGQLFQEAEKADIHASLRLQIATLTAQLARTEEKLNLAANGNSTHLGRNHRRSLWHRIRRGVAPRPW